MRKYTARLGMITWIACLYRYIYIYMYDFQGVYLNTDFCLKAVSGIIFEQKEILQRIFFHVLDVSFVI